MTVVDNEQVILETWLMVYVRRLTHRKLDLKSFRENGPYTQEILTLVEGSGDPAMQDIVLNLRYRLGQAGHQGPQKQPLVSRQSPPMSAGETRAAARPKERRYVGALR